MRQEFILPGTGSISIVHTLLCIRGLKTSYLIKRDETRATGIWELVILFSLLLYMLATFHNKVSVTSWFINFFHSPSQDIEYCHSTMIFLVFHFFNQGWLTSSSLEIHQSYSQRSPLASRKEATWRPGCSILNHISFSFGQENWPFSLTGVTTVVVPYS